MSMTFVGNAERIDGKKIGDIGKKIRRRIIEEMNRKERVEEEK